MILCAPIVMATAQSITINDSKTIDYTSFETFTVQHGAFTLPADEQTISKDSVYQYVKRIVKRELEQKGYHYVDDSTAQLNVSYVVGAYNVTAGGKVGPMGGGPITTPAMENENRYWSEEHRDGMLILEMTKRHSTTPIWSAEGTVTLTQTNMEHVLEGTIAKMLRKFPSRLKKRKHRR